MTEPSRSSNVNKKRTAPPTNHWFEASLIPNSRSMGMEGQGNLNLASGDDETYNVGRQFSEIAVDAFRVDRDFVDPTHTAEHTSFQRNISVPRLSRFVEAQQSANDQVYPCPHHQHYHPQQAFHQYPPSLAQTVPTYPHHQTARPIPKEISPSSSRRSIIACRQRPHSPLRANTSAASGTLTNTARMKLSPLPRPRLHTAPSQPVLLHTSSSGSDEYTERHSRHSIRGQVRPFSMHIAPKLESGSSSSANQSLPTSEKVEKIVHSPCKMRSAPSCPSQLGPIPMEPSSVTGPEPRFGSRIGQSCNTTNVVPVSTVSNTKAVASNALKERVCPRPNRTGTFGLYDIQETIGAGNFSQVKLATHMLTKELVAIKVLDKTRMDAPTRRLLSREISILEMLHHPNIIRLYEVMETLTRLHLVMEFVAGGDLNKRIKSYGKFTEHEAKIIFAQLIAAVNHLHERNIFHRDIKADNILFTHRIQIHPQGHSSCNASPSDRASNHGRAYGIKGNGYRRNLRKWLYSRTREGSRLYPRSRSETGRDTASRPFTVSESRAGDHRSVKTPQKRSRWDVSHANVELEAGGDQSQRQGINVCPEHYRVKLADFGFSKLTMTQDQPLTTFCGSPAYAAPELFQAQNYQGGPVDMWALGIVLFFLLTGLLPYRGSTVGQVRRLVLENRGLQPPEWLSVGATKLYQKLTARQPSDRPTAADLMRYAQENSQPNHSQAASSNDLVDGNAGESQSWMTWLAGQTFPKALPRFNKCPPPICSLRDKNDTKLEPKTTTPIRTTPNNNTNTISSSSSNHSTDGKQRGSSNRTETSNPVTEAVTTDSAVRPQVFTEINKASEHVSISSINSLMSQVTSDDPELEATRMLLELGVTRDELAAAENQDSRSAVTGAYRIMLHRAHRARRLSHLDPSMSVPPNNRTAFTTGIPNSISTPLINRNQFTPHETNRNRYRTLSPSRNLDRTRRRSAKTSRFCVVL